MNQHDATARILKFLKGKGERFQSAYEDKHTVVLESFSGRFKFEFTVLQKEAMLGLEIYIFKDDYDQTMLKECLKGNWKPQNWERQDINWGKKGGVAVRFFTPFKWRNLSNDDLEKSLDGYRAVCDKVKPCLVQDDSAKAQKRRRNWGARASFQRKSWLRSVSRLAA